VKAFAEHRQPAKIAVIVYRKVFDLAGLDRQARVRLCHVSFCSYRDGTLRIGLKLHSDRFADEGFRCRGFSRDGRRWVGVMPGVDFLVIFLPDGLRKFLQKFCRIETWS